MNFGPLRALALELGLQAHGVPVTVTRPAPDGTPIDARGIWLRTLTDDMPVGLESLGHRPELHRRDQRRVMALRRADVPTVPRGTAILAAEWAGGPAQVWRVDGVERLEADHTRVLLLLDDRATALLPEDTDAGSEGED